MLRGIGPRRPAAGAGAAVTPDTLPALAPLHARHAAGAEQRAADYHVRAAAAANATYADIAALASAPTLAPSAAAAAAAAENRTPVWAYTTAPLYTGRRPINPRSRRTATGTGARTRRRGGGGSNTGGGARSDDGVVALS